MLFRSESFAKVARDRPASGAILLNSPARGVGNEDSNVQLKCFFSAFSAAVIRGRQAVCCLVVVVLKLGKVNDVSRGRILTCSALNCHPKIGNVFAVDDRLIPALHVQIMHFNKEKSTATLTTLNIAINFILMWIFSSDQLNQAPDVVVGPSMPRIHLTTRTASAGVHTVALPGFFVDFLRHAARAPTMRPTSATTLLVGLSKGLSKKLGGGRQRRQ